MAFGARGAGIRRDAGSGAAAAGSGTTAHDHDRTAPADRPGSRPPEPDPEHARLERLSGSLLVLLPLLAAWVITLSAQVTGEGWRLWQLYLLMLGQSLALVWSRRFPLMVLIIVVLLDVNVYAGSMAAAFGLGAWGTPRRQWIGVAYGLVTLLGSMAINLRGDAEPPTVVVGMLAIAVLFVGFWLMGRLGARRRIQLHALRARSRRLQAERELAERHAAERERALLARELHDILNHAMTAIVLDADAAAETGDAAEARATLRRVAATGRDSLAELRRLLGVLRRAPSGGHHDPMAVPPRLEQLDELVRSIPDGGPRVRLERHGQPRPLAVSVELAAYRVVQESLTNVAKHAGAVETDVSLAYLSDRLTVRVVNAAPTAPPPPPDGAGMGLAGMRERVELVGGSLRAGPTHDGGFEVEASLPVGSAP